MFQHCCCIFKSILKINHNVIYMYVQTAGLLLWHDN